MNSQIAIFVINLDHRKDRMVYMQSQLEKLNLEWVRVSAVDATIATDDEIGVEVNLERQRIGMGRGSQCCAVTNFQIFRRIVQEEIPVAIILQDDVELSEDFSEAAKEADWVPEGVGLIQFEKFGRSVSSRLAGPSLSRVAGRDVRKLYSRTGGAACYLITRNAAEKILGEKGLLDVPIDHFLFSPNASPLFDKLGVAIVTPALARQRMEKFESDIAGERRKRRKSLASRLKRFALEINRLPMQLSRRLHGAKMIEFKFK